MGASSRKIDYTLCDKTFSNSLFSEPFLQRGNNERIIKVIVHAQWLEKINELHSRGFETCRKNYYDARLISEKIYQWETC